MPVLVTEALTFVDRNTAVSVNISVDGWAWLVYGRKLLVWQCKTNIHDPKQRRTFKTQCRELLLPQSDLAHKADCIAVWVSPGHQVLKKIKFTVILSTMYLCTFNRVDVFIIPIISSCFFFFRRDVLNENFTEGEFVVYIKFFIARLY